MPKEIKPIRTKADHRAALKKIETLMTARPGTPEGDRLNVLAALVEAWEKKRYPMAKESYTDEPLGNSACYRTSCRRPKTWCFAKKA